MRRALPRIWFDGLPGATVWCHTKKRTHALRVRSWVGDERTRASHALLRAWDFFFYEFPIVPVFIVPIVLGNYDELL